MFGSPKTRMEILTPNVMILGSKVFGAQNPRGMVPPCGQGNPQSSLDLFLPYLLYHIQSIYNLEKRDLYQNLIMMATWSQSSSLQKWEKYISAVYKLLRYGTLICNKVIFVSFLNKGTFNSLKIFTVSYFFFTLTEV